MPSHPPETLVLFYEDFGPQVSAYGLLGGELYAWTNGGCLELEDVFDIRVVVYRALSLTRVAAMYPVIENRSDYRYVEHRAALAYLDATIGELERDLDPFDTILHDLLRQLQTTRAKIQSALGD